MATPLRVPVSLFQKKRLDAFAADATALNARQSEYITAVIAATHDPDSLQGWRIELEGDAIVCTPPEGQTTPSTDTGPALVA